MSFEERGQDTPIDTRNGTMSNNATPTEHTASPASPTHSAGSARGSTKSAFQSHGKSWSMASEATLPLRANRFSVQFPIQPSGSNTPARTTSPVREPAACVPVADALAALQSGAPDSSSFLSLIASQERRVLELKEELHRAEADLDKLKRQWARHEVQKKRENGKRMTKLQPLQTSLPAADKEEDVDGSSAWMQQEMERRKALLSRSNTNGGRTILPGQRHTRALSLLSPARDNVRDTAAPAPTGPLPPRKESLKNRESSEASIPERPILITRQSEASDLTNEVDRIADAAIDLTQRASIDQEALLRHGKKMATDFKDGLWTFWEDLRQATVGEESHLIPPPPRRKSSTQTLKAAQKQGSRNSLRPSSRGSSTVSRSSEQTKQPSPARKQWTPAALPDLADPTFWSEFGVTAPTTQTTQPANKKPTTSKHAKSPSVKRLSVMSSDPWDTWDDSPEQSRSSSSVTSETTTLPSTVSGSPRTSINAEGNHAEKRDSIPWPVLKKSGFGSLRRTASNLLNEWEASLKPPTTSPGQERQDQPDYLGASAEAAAYGAKKPKDM